jgi:hypothetical protein
MCDEKVWDETLMEDGAVPSTTGSKKQQVSGWLRTMRSLFFVIIVIFPLCLLFASYVQRFLLFSTITSSTVCVGHKFHGVACFVQML